MVDEAFLQFRSDLTTTWDPFLQQKYDDINNELLQREYIEPEQSGDIQSLDTLHSFLGYRTTPT